MEIVGTNSIVILFFILFFFCMCTLCALEKSLSKFQYYSLLCILSVFIYFTLFYFLLSKWSIWVQSCTFSTVNLVFFFSLRFLSFSFSFSIISILSVIYKNVLLLLFLFVECYLYDIRLLCVCSVRILCVMLVFLFRPKRVERESKIIMLKMK